MLGDRGAFLNDLIASRPAFDGSTEADQVCTLVDEFLPRGAIDWLEVGAGDGRHLQHSVRTLSNGRTFRVVAVEPAPIGAVPKDVEWLSVPVENYVPDRRFGWVNMRHSAYYMADPVREITRLANAISGTGAVALTHWSRRCILYRLHVAICGEPQTIGCHGVEGIRTALASLPGLELSPIHLFETHLSVDRLSRDPALGAAIYELARRGRTALSGRDPPNKVTDLLAALDRPNVRVNGLLFVRRNAI